MCNETPNESNFTWLQIFLPALIKGVFSKDEALILQDSTSPEMFKVVPRDSAEQFLLGVQQLNLAMLSGVGGKEMTGRCHIFRPFCISPGAAFFFFNSKTFTSKFKMHCEPKCIMEELLVM